RPVVAVQHALTYFNEVVDAIRLRRGNDDRMVVVRTAGEPTMQVIGALTLTTLLENSDTHGYVGVDHPITVRFVFARGRMEFTCSNAKNRTSGNVNSTGEGLNLVTQELALLDRHDVRFSVQ